MITGYFIDIGHPLDKDVYEQLLAKVAHIQKAPILDQPKRKLIGKLLIYKLLCVYNLEHNFFIDAQCVNRWGKPYFADTDFDFNLSHSGSILFCGGVQGGHIGVDIEKEEERDITGMQAYFCEQEWTRINNSTNVVAEFYRMWVRKEACIKAAGKGIFQPLVEIDVSAGQVIADGIRWHPQDIFIRPGYAACIATDKKMEIRIEELDLNKLI